MRRCCLSTLLLSPVGVRAAPLDARLRVLRVVPLVPLRALIPEDRCVRFIRRACVGCRQTVQVLPTFRASSRRRATELFFRGAVMVFLVFLEVLEMSSEVVGPGPNTREIKSLRVDPGPLACVQGLPAHDYNTTNHPPLVAPTSCPSTTRWMQLAVPAQSFAWLDETCASSARALLRGSDFYFHILRRRQHDHLPQAASRSCGPCGAPTSSSSW